MTVYVVFDDTNRKGEIIEDIIGQRQFADVIVRRRRLEDYYREHVLSVYPGAVWVRVRSPFEFGGLLETLDGLSGDVRVLHCFSHYFIADAEKALLSFRKLPYVTEPYRALPAGSGARKSAALLFPSAASYAGYVRSCARSGSLDAARGIAASFDIEGLVDIGTVHNFIQCITGSFDARYFNSLSEGEYTVVKRSANRQKIRAEYTYYHLLPEDMRHWFVMPFNYREDADGASYTMERLFIADLAIKWVHGSLGREEFSELMDRYFYFFRMRHSRPCSAGEYERTARELYEEKVVRRIRELRGLAEYGRIAAFLTAAGMSVEGLVERYRRLRQAVAGRNRAPCVSVIGHGDPCFANALYNRATKTLKFIDPRGALCEEELWTDPYYDVAKLSHSVCGLYDFFNNALFAIRVGGGLDYELDIDFDNTEYVAVFREKCEENGFDYLTVRVYEASLFLSMLPLHIDNPHKVFGFILNARRILEEIEHEI